MGEAHDEDEVDGHEPQEIGRHHSVNHDNGRAGQLEASESVNVGSLAAAERSEEPTSVKMTPV